MSEVDFVRVVDTESERFAEAVAAGSTDWPVSACPGWTLRDLVAHLGEVQRFWAGAVRAGGEWPGEPALVEPGDRDLSEWYDESRTVLLAALGDVDPAAPCWAWWGPDQTVADVTRRQAHEAAVHRWDAQRAGGNPRPLDAALAADGVDEFFERMVPASREGWDGPGGVLTLAAADTGRVWTVRLGGPRPELIPLGASGAVNVSVGASSADLDLLLWRRRDLDTSGIRVDGSSELAAAFFSWTKLE